MLTDFGKAVRKARIDVGTSMADMAEYLGVKPSFLSQVEFGRKSVPESFVKRIEDYFARYGLSIKLGQLADAANKSVTLKGLVPEMQFLVSGFARGTLTEQQINRVRELLDEMEKNKNGDEQKTGGI